MRRVWGALLVAACAVAVPACDRNERTAPAVSASAEMPVPVPRGLVAEIVVNQPQAVWRRVREWMGPGAIVMPGGLGMLVTSVAGLPPLAAGLIDDRVPLVGALVEAQDGAAGWVVGVHLTSGRELVARLTTGGGARFRARLDSASEVTLLEPVAGAGEVSLAVHDHYLLVGRSPEVLTAAGAYVAVELPARPEASGAIVMRATRGALAGGLTRMVRRAWSAYRADLERADAVNRSLRGGRAPDFGEPAAVILALSGVVDEVTRVLESSTELRVVVEPLGEYPWATIELVPAAGGAAHELVSDLSAGGLAPLLALPDTVTVGVVSWAPKKPSRTVEAVTERLASVFGPRLDVEGRRRIEAVVRTWVKGLGDPIAYGLVDRGAPALFVDAPIADDELLKVLPGQLEGVFATSAVAAPLEAFAGKLTLQKSKPDLHLGEDFARRVRLASVGSRKPSGAMPASAPALEATWAGLDGRLVGVLGVATSPQILQGFVAEGKRLADHPAIGALARRAGSASLAAVLQLDAPGAPRPHAAMATLEREADVMRGRFGFSEGAARVLARAVLAP